VTGNPLEDFRTTGGVIEITGRSRFILTGADRLRYLNGQVSNDLRKLQPGRAMLACILSAKGRLDGVVWIWSEEGRLVVECDADQSEQIGARLERYIVADDVELSAIEFEGCLHVFGPAALKDGPEGALRIDRLGCPGIDLPPGASVEAPLAGADVAEYLRIENRVPRWGAELTPETLPAEAGLDETAVDFHKGCYIGQEVVSRVKSVGHVNRQLHVFEVVSGPVPTPGVLVRTGADGREAGVVTSVAPQFALSPVIGLCYIKRGVDPAATLILESGPTQIQLRQLECATSS